MVFKWLRKLRRKEVPEYPYESFYDPTHFVYPTSSWHSGLDYTSQPYSTSYASVHDALALHEALDGYPVPNRQHELWWFDTRSSPFPSQHDPHEFNRKGLKILYDPATDPPCARMEVTSSEFPRSRFTIESSARVGYVRVGDVLWRVYEYMQERVKDMEPPSQMSVHDPVWQAMKRFQEKQWENERGKRVGFRRVDDVGKRTKFVGLTKLPSSMWRMELAELSREDSYL